MSTHFGTDDGDILCPGPSGIDERTKEPAMVTCERCTYLLRQTWAAKPEEPGKDTGMPEEWLINILRAGPMDTSAQFARLYEQEHEDYLKLKAELWVIKERVYEICREPWAPATHTLLNALDVHPSEIRGVREEFPDVFK